MPLLWKDTGQVSDERPGEQIVHPIQKGQFLAPPRYQAISVSLTQCTHRHSDSGTYLYIHVHPERPPPTWFQTLSGTYALHTDALREHLPPVPSAHIHSHSILNTPSPKEPHVNTCTQAYPETCTHSYSHPCTHNTPHSTHIYMLFTHVLIYTHTHTHSTTSTRPGVARPDGHGPHEGVQSHRYSCMHTYTALQTPGPQACMWFL